MIIINFKNYKSGKDVLSLAKKIHNKKILVCIPSVNIKEVIDKTKLKVYAQHVDYQNSKRSTGFVTPKSIKKAGVLGTLLNHSEHKLKLEEIKRTVNECKKLNLKVIVCASNLKEVNQIKKLKPFAIAFEDPKLIATGKSITKYNSKVINTFIKIIEKTKIIPICGAGISSREDYLKALELGCKGVLISSAIANSKTPEKFLKEISKI
jgi:triosephosphate isomerase|tara:strand:+ start:5717 stop:6340 length:624 start_codon:yes stop_codon:yes gene_type:complete